MHTPLKAHTDPQNMHTHLQHMHTPLQHMHISLKVQVHGSTDKCVCTYFSKDMECTHYEHISLWRDWVGNYIMLLLIL